MINDNDNLALLYADLPLRANPSCILLTSVIINGLYFCKDMKFIQNDYILVPLLSSFNSETSGIQREGVMRDRGES